MFSSLLPFVRIQDFQVWPCGLCRFVVMLASWQTTWFKLNCSPCQNVLDTLPVLTQWTIIQYFRWLRVHFEVLLRTPITQMIFFNKCKLTLVLKCLNIKIPFKIFVSQFNVVSHANYWENCFLFTVWLTSSWIHIVLDGFQPVKIQ